MTNFFIWLLILSYQIDFKTYKHKIEALEERYAIGEIDKELFTKFSTKYRTEKMDLSTEIDSLSFENSNLEKCVEKYAQLLTKLPILWASNSYKGKLELQELLFPEGIVYDREISNYRTPKINEAIFAMAQLAKLTTKNEKRTIVLPNFRTGN